MRKLILFLTTCFVLLCSFSFLGSPTPTTAAAEPANHLIINQVYGGGKKAENGNSTPISHSFIELYNPTDQDIDLYGMSLQYAESGSNTWAVLPLSNTILPAHTSYLVRGQQHTYEDDPNLKLNITEYDQIWEENLNNKGVKVVLLSNTRPLTVNNPFTGDGKGQVEGYIDMFGIAGNDVDAASNPLLTVDGYEGQYASGKMGQSKHKAFRRVNFVDTDNNYLDFEMVDYRFEDTLSTELIREINLVRPRSMADGPWPLDFMEAQITFESNDFPQTSMIGVEVNMPKATAFDHNGKVPVTITVLDANNMLVPVNGFSFTPTKSGVHTIKYYSHGESGVWCELECTLTVEWIEDAVLTIPDNFPIGGYVNRTLNFEGISAQDASGILDYTIEIEKPDQTKEIVTNNKFKPKQTGVYKITITTIGKNGIPVTITRNITVQPESEAPGPNATVIIVISLFLVVAVAIACVLLYRRKKTRTFHDNINLE